jgi:hypothetical protein
MEYGLLVPADPAADPVRIHWPHPAKFLPELWHALDSQDLDYASITRPDVSAPGGLRYYCRGDSLLQDAPAYNDRALAIIHHFGYRVSACAGPVVFIGYPPGEDEGGLHPQMLEFLTDACRTLTQQLLDRPPTPHGGRPS